MKDKIKIFISGDFAPRMRVNDVIASGDCQKLFNDILTIIKNADFAITNMESPLMDGGKPIEKTGPNLKSPTKSVEALKYAGFDMVTLANNHALDYGAEGLLSTIKLCEENGIHYIGAGNNLKEASRVRYFELKGQKISFINCCENEWSTTSGENPGCNPLNEVGLYYQIKEAKTNSDKTILIVHGGHETYEWPSPRMIKLYRWFIDLGVDAVIGHHTHCFSGYEIYHGKPIVYSLGNFIFDSERRNSSWNIGAAALLSINNQGIDLELIPFTQCDKEVGIQLLSSKENDRWMNEARLKKEKINDSYIIEKEFNEFVKRQSNSYKQMLERGNRLLSFLKRKHILPYKVDGKIRKWYLNLIRTEAHRDIIISMLNKNSQI